MFLKKSFIIVLIMLFGACGKTSKQEQKDKIQVLASTFPVYDFTREIAKDKIELDILIPFGVEPHSFEPSPKDMGKISKSKLFVYTNDIMEPWIAQLKKSNYQDKVAFLNASKNIDEIKNGLNKTKNHHDHEEEHAEHHHHILDPHTWLDPIFAKDMVTTISNELIENDPKNKEFYVQNTKDYLEKLDKLDEKIRNGLKNTKNRTIIYGGHFAFGYFVKRYDLDYISPFKNFSPSAEARPKKVAEMINLIKKNDIKYIYYEEIVDPKIARAIANESGARILELNGIHNISKQDFENGSTYLNIMYKNLENLKKGLELNEGTLENK